MRNCFCSVWTEIYTESYFYKWKHIQREYKISFKTNSHSACSILLKRNSKLSIKPLADHPDRRIFWSAPSHEWMVLDVAQWYSNMERMRRDVRFPLLLLHAASLPRQPAQINNVSNLGCQSIQNQTWSGQITDLSCSGWKSSKKKVSTFVLIFLFGYSLRKYLLIGIIKELQRWNSFFPRS